MTKSRQWLACVGAAVGLVAVMPCAGAAETMRFTSVARDLKSDRIVYTEAYEVQVDKGRWLSGTTRYFLPNGAPIGERKFDFSYDRYMPVYSLEQSNFEYREGISKIEPGVVDVYMFRDGERRNAALARVQNMVADCGSQPYLIDHLDKLQAGEMLHFTLAVPGKVDSFKLRASKAGDVQVNGKRAMRVRIEVDSLLRLILPQLELTIDPETKRMLEYSGVTNIKDPVTHKSHSARVTFSYK